MWVLIIDTDARRERSELAVPVRNHKTDLITFPFGGRLSALFYWWRQCSWSEVSGKTTPHWELQHLWTAGSVGVSPAWLCYPRPRERPVLRSGLAEQSWHRAAAGRPRRYRGLHLSLRRVFHHDTLRGTLTRSVPSFITLREDQNMSNKSTIWFLLAY